MEVASSKIPLHQRERLERICEANKPPPLCQDLFCKMKHPSFPGGPVHLGAKAPAMFRRGIFLGLFICPLNIYRIPTRYQALSARDRYKCE